MWTQLFLSPTIEMRWDSQHSWNPQRYLCQFQSSRVSMTNKDEVTRPSFQRLLSEMRKAAEVAQQTRREMSPWAHELPSLQTSTTYFSALIIRSLCQRCSRCCRTRSCSGSHRLRCSWSRSRSSRTGYKADQAWLNIQFSERRRRWWWWCWMEALGVEPSLTILQVSAERRDRWTFALHMWMKCSFLLRSWKRPHFKKRLIKQPLQNSWSQMWCHAASRRIVERAGYVWGSALSCELWRGKGRGSRMQLQTDDRFASL